MEVISSTMAPTTLPIRSMHSTFWHEQVDSFNGSTNTVIIAGHADLNLDEENPSFVYAMDRPFLAETRLVSNVLYISTPGRPWQSAPVTAAVLEQLAPFQQFVRKSSMMDWPTLLQQLGIRDVRCQDSGDTLDIGRDVAYCTFTASRLQAFVLQSYVKPALAAAATWYGLRPPSEESSTESKDYRFELWADTETGFPYRWRSQYETFTSSVTEQVDSQPSDEAVTILPP